MAGSGVPLEAIPLHPVGPGESREEREFALIEREILHHIFRANTRMAILRGLHAYDGQLPIVRPQETSEWVEGAREWLERLQAQDRAQLSRLRQLDHHVLHLRLQAGLFWQVDKPTLDLSPLDYLFPIQLTEYISRDYAPAGRRAAAVVRQLGETPGFLRSGLERLKGPLPRPFVTQGLEILKGLPSHFNAGVGFVREHAPSLAGSAEEGKEKTLEALDAFGRHLEDELPRSDDSFQLGPERFQKLLWVTDGLRSRWEDLLQEGLSDLRRNQQRLDQLAGRAEPPGSVPGLVGSLFDDTSSAGDLLEQAQGCVHELRDLVLERKLASLPDDLPCRVEESSPADSTFALASMHSAGPFEEGSAAAVYRLTLPGPAVDSGSQRPRIRSLALPALRNITAHEVYPGHYLQFQHFRRARSSPTRKAFPSATFSEGWGHYAEQLVIEQGYRREDTRQEVAQILGALLRDCRLLASIAMHAQGRTLEEASQIFAREAYMERFLAEREAQRGTFDPSYFEYTLGKLRILEARKAYFECNPRGSLGEFHDRILGEGAPPVGLLKVLALGEPLAI